MRHEFTTDELRAIRREWINAYLHDFRDANNPMPLSEIKYYVRFLEFVNYGEELRIYSHDA